MRVVVVGAGIFGASAAYHLARAGADVEIIDEGHEGRASFAGAGIVCPWQSRVEDPEFYRLYEACGHYYPSLIETMAELGETQFGYRRVGSLTMAADPADFAAAEKRIFTRTANLPQAGKVERISAADAKRLFPPLRDDREAIFISGAARVEVDGITQALVRIATRHGTRRRSGHVVLAVDKGRARASVAGRPIDADMVVVAAGAWAPHILGPLGIRTSIAPQKGQIIHLRLPGVDTRNWPVLLPVDSHYMLAFDDSRVVVGATRETGSGFDYRVTAAGQAEVLNFGLQLAPGLAGATLIETRIGFRPSADNIRPILARVDGIEGLVVGNGLGASGITMGPMAGKMLAQLALGEKPDLDLSAFPIH